MREQNYALNGNAQAEQLEVSRVLRNTRLTSSCSACALPFSA